MKKLLLSIFTMVVIYSCSNKIIPIQGTYPNTPIEIKSDKNFDEVWDNLVDLFAQKGLSIKIIDKSSGLIISDRYKIPVTIENKNGEIEDKDAFMVVPKIKNVGLNRYEPVTGVSGVYGKKITPNPVFCEWNVRIKKLDKGTTINVNLVNVTYEFYNSKFYTNKSLYTYKSTGVFEKIISDKIK